MDTKNKYLTLVPTNESKERIKNIKNCGVKSDDYDEKHMKIKFNSDDEIPLNKAI